MERISEITSIIKTSIPISKSQINKLLKDLTQYKIGTVYIDYGIIDWIDDSSITEFRMIINRLPDTISMIEFFHIEGFLYGWMYRHMGNKKYNFSIKIWFNS